MMERGIEATGASGGLQATTLALRGGRQPDHLGRGRGLVLLDRAGRQVDAGVVVRDWMAEDDGLELAALTAAQLASRLRVGAARRLVLDVRHLLPDGQATITPLVCAPDGSRVLAMLPSQAAPAAFRELAMGGAWRATRLQWDLCGAPCVAVHVAGLHDGPSGNAVQVLGGVALPQGVASLGGAALAVWEPVPDSNPNTGQTTPEWAV